MSAFDNGFDTLKRHYGFLENTGTRVIVVFRSLPADPTNALVVHLDALPDSWRDELLNCVNSQAGQSTVDLYTALQHRSFSDGSNVLNGLHTHQHLRKVPVSQVMMTPLTGQKVPLKLVNDSIDKKSIVEEVVAPKAEIEIDPVVLAKGLLAEAAELEKQALAKKQEAWTLDPTLKPNKTGPAPLTAEERAQSDIEIKAKRLERDRKNAEKAKVEKKEKALTDKINKKILRDATRTTPVELPDDLASAGE
jgi:hypothetical protein